MRTMTPREAAAVRLRGVLGWGAALTAVGELLVGLVAVGVRLGLAAYGVAPSDEHAGR